MLETSACGLDFILHKPPRVLIDDGTSRYKVRVRVRVRVRIEVKFRIGVKVRVRVRVRLLIIDDGTFVWH